jgi:hypothetical protein
MLQGTRRSRIWIRRVVLALAGSCGLVVGSAPSADAQSVQGYDNFHVTVPGIACTPWIPGSLVNWAGEIANWNPQYVNPPSGQPQTLWVDCPLIVDDSMGLTVDPTHWVAVYSAGTYQGVSCYLKWENASRSGNSVPENSRTFDNANHIWEEELWNSNIGVSPGPSPFPHYSLECSLAPNAILEGYDYRANFVNWEY